MTNFYTSTISQSTQKCHKSRFSSGCLIILGLNTEVIKVCFISGVKDGLGVVIFLFLDFLILPKAGLARFPKPGGVSGNVSIPERTLNIGLPWSPALWNFRALATWPWVGGEIVFLLGVHTGLFKDSSVGTPVILTLSSISLSMRESIFNTSLTVVME